MSIPNYSVRLSHEAVVRLNALAEQLGCYANTGPNTGDPSWRVLVKHIGSGELTVVRAKREASATKETS